MLKLEDIVSRLLIAWGALWIIILGIMGTWLHDAEYPIKSLVISGHNHGFCFAFGAVLAGLILWKFKTLPRFWHWIVLLLVVISCLLPLGLIIGGMGGKPGDWMSTMSALGGWGFVVYWLIISLTVLCWRQKKTK